jgi:phosphoglycolate phosphatase
MKGVIFDLDGTLLNSLGDLAISANYALKECGYPARSIDEVRNMVGYGVGKLIERAMPCDVSEQEYNRCLDVFKRHYVVHCDDNTSPYPGIMQLLENLYNNGVSLAIASNKLQPAVTQLCTRFFSPFVKIFLGESAEVQRKPKPDMLIKAMSLMRCASNEVVYVGDSEVDIATAEAANVQCVSVLWGFRSKEFLMEHGASLLAKSPLDIEDIFGRLCKKTKKNPESQRN